MMATMLTHYCVSGLVSGRCARLLDIGIENPCVGGSIPPRATKNIVHATPNHASGRCRLWGPQSSAPVHFRLSACIYADKARTQSTFDGTDMDDDHLDVVDLAALGPMTME